MFACAKFKSARRLEKFDFFSGKMDFGRCLRNSSDFNSIENPEAIMKEHAENFLLDFAKQQQQQQYSCHR